MNADKPELGIIYGRISRDARKKDADGQAIESNEVQGSLDKQEDACLEYIKAQGMTLVKAFVDANVSGGRFIEDRPGGKLLWQYLVENAPKSKLNLIIFAPDRLGRRASDIFTKLEDLADMGVDLHVVDMGKAATDENSWLVLALRVVFAQWELRTTSKRYQATVNYKLSNGERVCRASYGFDFKPSGRFKLLPDGKTKKEIFELVENPEEIKWLWWLKARRETIIGIAENGNPKYVTYDAISAELNKLGVPTKGGVVGGWTGSRVESVLNSRHTLEKVFAFPEKNPFASTNQVANVITNPEPSMDRRSQQ